MPDTRLDQILRRYLQQHLTVVKSEMDRGKEEIIKVVELIMRKVEEKDPRFKMELKFRGSVYEKVKIKKADEFDFDLPITLLAIEDCPRGRMAGVPSGLYTFHFVQGLSTPHQWGLFAFHFVQGFSTLHQWELMKFPLSL